MNISKYLQSNYSVWSYIKECQCYIIMDTENVLILKSNLVIDFEELNTFKEKIIVNVGLMDKALFYVILKKKDIKLIHNLAFHNWGPLIFQKKSIKILCDPKVSQISLTALRRYKHEMSFSVSQSVSRRVKEFLGEMGK